MRIEERSIVVRCFVSDVVEVSSERASDEELIRWADEHPRAWRIVMNGKSKAWGRSSSKYLGWAQGGLASEAVLERLATFRRYLDNADGFVDGFFHKSARFTYDHAEDKKLAGGFFQQWARWSDDGKVYARACADLDYTPGTLEEVIERFLAWGNAYPNTTRVTLDGRDVRIIAEEGSTT